MADVKESSAPTYIAFILIIVAIVVLVYLARDVASTTLSDIGRTSSATSSPATGVSVSDGAINRDSSMAPGASPSANWVTYADQAWGYKLRFPSNYRARLIDSNELVSPIPGEVILSGIVVAPASSVNADKTPNYAKESLTLLVTDWSSFGTAQNFLNQTYISGAVPKEQIERITISGHNALRLRVASVLGGLTTSHMEILIAGAGSQVFKIVYWPADDSTLAAVAASTMIPQSN